MSVTEAIAYAKKATIQFNLNVLHGRSGPGAADHMAIGQDLKRQGILIEEEHKEMMESRDVVNLLKECIDMVVVNVWQSVLGHSLMTECSIKKSAQMHMGTGNMPSIFNAPVSVEEEMLLMLARMGVQVEDAITDVIDDNDSKATYEEDAKAGMEYYPGIDCKVKQVADGRFMLFRDDGKYLKPASYMDRHVGRDGPILEEYVPGDLQFLVLHTQSMVE